MKAWRSPHDSGLSATALQRNALIAALSLSVIAFVGQLAGAWYTGSLALLGDTAHLFTDLLSLAMSLTAVLLAARPADHARSFGLYRLEVLAAFLNGLLLVGVSIGLGYESVQRLFAPQEIRALPLLYVSVGGLCLNLLSALVLARALKGVANAPVHHHHEHSHDHHHGCGHGHDHKLAPPQAHHHDHAVDDRNLRGAFLHVLSDALSSVAVMAGALIVYFTGYFIVDAILGLALAFVIAFWSLRLLLDAGHVLLEATPRHISAERVVARLRGKDSRVLAVEDLHVWEITSRMYAATAEVRVSVTELNEAELIRVALDECLREEFGIAHSVLAIRPR